VRSRRQARPSSRLPIALAACALALGACGQGDEGGGGGLAWKGEPRILPHPTLRQDRILTGTVRNDSLRRVTVDAAALRLLDGDGRRVRGSAIFLQGFGHQLYPPTREPARVPESERVRTGQKVRLAPDDTAPLTLSWRVGRGGRRPVRVDYGSGSLPIPAR
jgi:hypothetical protein